MREYKSIGTKGVFRPPQPWVFKPVLAFRFKMMLKFTLGIFLIYILATVIIVLNVKDQPVRYLVLFLTIPLIIYMIIVYIALNRYYNSFEYQVHGTEIIIKNGLFNLTEAHLPFSNITNIAIRQGLFDQILGIGSILIYTAGRQTSSYQIASIAGTRIYKDVGYFVLNQIKTYETFFTYLFGEHTTSKRLLDKEFWTNFLYLVKDIKKQLKNNQ